MYNVYIMNIYKQYASVRLELEKLEEKAGALKVQILEDLKSRNIKKDENSFGVFSLCSKKNWSFSPKIKKLEENLKIAKYTEQEKGIAKVDITEYLTWTSIK